MPVDIHGLQGACRTLYGARNFCSIHKKAGIPAIDNGDLQEYKFAMGLGRDRTKALISACLAIFAVTPIFMPASLAQAIAAALTGTVNDSPGAVAPTAVATQTGTNTAVSRPRMGANNAMVDWYRQQ
jgi:hypothetical protein